MEHFWPREADHDLKALLSKDQLVGNIREYILVPRSLAEVHGVPVPHDGKHLDAER